jgi:hypothetical protein
MYIFERPGINRLNGYPIGVVWNDTEHDDSELIASVVQKCLRDHGIKTMLYDVTCKDIYTLAGAGNFTTPDVIFHNYFWGFILNQERFPRKYHYNPEFVMETQVEEKTRFYNITKFYEFAIQGLTSYRVPIGCGVEDNRVVFHPGNSRIMRLSVVEKHFPIQLMISDLPHNKQILHTVSQLAKPVCLNDLNLKELQTLIRSSEFKGVSVRYSNVIGLQFVETHSRLPEYYKDYTVEWTGNKMFVNDMCVAEYNQKQDMFKLV